MKVETVRDLQLEVMEVFERKSIEQLHVYTILDDLVKTIKAFLNKEEGLDIDKLIKQKIDKLDKND